MAWDTDVLIVGGGPTGLMMACQLARYGIAFRIIDKQADRAHESRAFGIQARSMEIFQNLGIVSEFLQRAMVVKQASFYFNGKLRFNFDFSRVEIKDTPFSSFFFLPQSETEQIFIEHLKKLNINVERQTELVTFNQDADGVSAEIKNNLTGKQEKIRCRYLVGCDGAHSTVRHILDVPFLGGAYRQEFVLADVAMDWPFPSEQLMGFISNAGNLVYIPLHPGLSRIIIMGMNTQQLDDRTPDLKELENFSRQITHSDIQIKNAIWVSRFHLHHRAVKQYMEGRAFLVGDAAHIHSPVGAQGMNTGLQDATNLAWKIAFVLKYQVPTQLLRTYQIERQRIGEVLVNTTDKLFELLSNRSFIISLMRQYIVPFIMHFLTKLKQFNRYFFRFMSELAVRYHDNPFVVEQIEGADSKFLAGPQAGCRAPDAPLPATTLFDIFKQKPCNVLLFEPHSESFVEMTNLEKIQPELIGIYKFVATQDTKILFDRYGISTAGIYFIRPDGYIGFRSFGKGTKELLQYLHRFFK